MARRNRKKEVLWQLILPTRFITVQVLRKNSPKLAIIMLSTDDTNRADALRMGFDGLMCKPVSTELLRAVVKSLAV